jgi:DNA-binding transcriptional ArsR family regulator
MSRVCWSGPGARCCGRERCPCAADPAVTSTDGPLDDLFGALADATRRRLLSRLVHEGPATATELAVDLPFTRQAVVKHLQALAEAGLVSSERQGREVRYRATPEPLVEAIAWMLDAGPAWDRRLERLRKRIVPR